MGGGDCQFHNALRAGELTDPAGGVNGGTLGNFTGGEITEFLKKRGQFFPCARLRRGGRALQLVADGGDGFGFEQVSQVDILEQILQQIPVDCQCL